VVVWDGVGLGAGGFGDGFTVGLLDVGLGFGRDGVGAELAFAAGLAECLAGLAFLATCLDGEAEGEGVALAEAAVPP
jgi:hypothetical protein